MPPQLEDDSVSLNSTAISEGQDEYVIDGGILAERINDKQTFYLVKWEGYDEHRNTWEPEENFTSGNTLKRWQERKTRIARGLDKPFDLDALGKRQEKIMDEAAERKQMRRLKRRRLGSHVKTPSSFSEGGRGESDAAAQLLSSKQHPSIVEDTVSQQRLTEAPRRHSVPPKVWTDQERRALEVGVLRVGGPWWNTILTHYGLNGTVNQDLKRMNESDLQQMVSELEKKFLAAGQDPPNWVAHALSLWLKGRAPSDRASLHPNSSHNLSDSEALPQDDRNKQIHSILEEASRDSPSKLKPSNEATKICSSATSKRIGSSLDLARFNFPPLPQQSSARARSLSDLTNRNRRSISDFAEKSPGEQSKRVHGGDISPVCFKPSKAKSNSPIKKPDARARRTTIGGKDLNSDASIFYSTYSKQYWANKKGRDEPAPRVHSLSLIDPGLGKIPKTMPALPLEIPPEKRENGVSNHQGDMAGFARANVQNGREIMSVEPTIANSPFQIVPDDDAFQNAPDDCASSTEKPEDSTQLPENLAVISQSRDVRRRESVRPSVEGFAVLGRFRTGNDSGGSYLVRLQVFAAPEVIPFNREVSIRIKKTCLAAEYQKFYHAEHRDYIGWGHIDPESISQNQIHLLATRLATDLSGAFGFAEMFSMVIYPVGSSAWAFLDRDLPATPEGVILRFVLRKPLPPSFEDMENPDHANYWKQNPDQYQQIMISVHDDPLTKSINVVFKETYGIDYHRLLSNRKHNFFLLFIPAGCESYEKDPSQRQALKLRTSEEHDLTVDFLHSNGAHVFSLQEVGSTQPKNDGSWDFFVRRVTSGVVIIHDACMRIDQIPNLAKVLRNSIFVWRISLEPMEGARHPHLVRHFPHGAVVLLTESLMLYRPYDALRILMWFRLAILSGTSPKLPGTWKIAIRPHVCSWLLEIMELYERTRKNIFGCGKQVFADLYMNITSLLEREYITDGGEKHTVRDRMACLGGENEAILTEDAPLIAPASPNTTQTRREWSIFTDQTALVEIHHDNIRRNDDQLVRWFAEWAVLNCADFRKFHVVLASDCNTNVAPSAQNVTYPDSSSSSAAAAEAAAARYSQTWGHIETFAAPDSFFKLNKVPSQRELDALETQDRDRRRRGSGGPLLR